MWSNPFLAQRLAEERIKDMLREAEEERVVQQGAVSRRSSIMRPALLALCFVGAIVLIWQFI